MIAAAARDIYISFFLFTTNLRPTDAAYRKVILEHIRQLRSIGYAGFEFPIAPTHDADRAAEVESYAALRRAIDDAGFAEQWVRSRRVNVGKGKRALAAELRTKGVDNEVIIAALADIDASAERERAEQLVRDKLRRERLGDDDDAKLMRRLVGVLARRGYHQSMALDVVTVELANERERRAV